MGSTTLNFRNTQMIEQLGLSQQVRVALITILVAIFVPMSFITVGYQFTLSIITQTVANSSLDVSS
jgi:hypothetical protein